MARLIGFIFVFAVFLVFIVFNLNNKCDISFLGWTVAEVPVFITAFASFFLGMVSAFPFLLLWRRKRAGRADAAVTDGTEPAGAVKAGAAAGKKRGKKDAGE